MSLPFTASALGLWFRAWVWLVVGLLLGGCQAPEVSASQALVHSQQWRIDQGGQATLADMQAATDWQPLPEWKSWGYGPETIWVRLNLRADYSGATQPWVVQVRPSYLDYVTLYDPTNGLVQRTGDALPPNDTELATINLTFQIPAMASERTVYLKMRSVSTRVMQVKVMSYGEAQKENRHQEWFFGFIVIVWSVFAVWAFVQWFYTREQVIGAFALKQLTATLWGFLMLGFARVTVGYWLPERYLSDIASSGLFWLIGISIWFTAMVIREYRPWPMALWGCYGLVAFLLTVLPVLYWAGQPYLALKIGNICIPLGIALLSITLLSAWKNQNQKPIPQKVMLLYLCCLGLFSSALASMHLLLVDANSFVLFGSIVHTVFDGIVMFFVMRIRARDLAKEKQKITLDLYRSQEKVQAEARHREEQSQLFAMLAHEMKTPLATLRMWMDAGQLKRDSMERAIADMNQVIERCVHTGQLADQGLQAIAQTTSPIELTRSCIQACRSPQRVNFTQLASHASVHTDPQMLSIVLGNLLDNACKYGAPQAPIEVTLKSTVQDDCPGWLWQVSNLAGPAGLPDADRLFEKYYRSPQARRLSGSGLGLFLVKGLLDLMQGSITYSAQGERAVFSFWVPAKPSLC